MTRRLLLATLVFAFLCASCTQRTPEDDQIIREAVAHRSEVDNAFRNDPDSPFNRDTTIHYDGIKWFPPDPIYCFHSQLYRYERPETVVVYGTKGEARTQVKYGYFRFRFDGKDRSLNVYKSVSPDSREAVADNQLAVWFTDETTGKETYEVGRYVDVGQEVGGDAHLYTINLNNAYNPYCAYSALYSCAIPRKEDHLDFEVRAGEMKYHH